MLDVLQWPALAVTVAALWLVATDLSRRPWGYSLALVASALWAAWAWHAGAWALAVLQVLLAGGALRGIARTRSRDEPPSDLELDALASIRSRRPDADFAALVREGAAPRPERRRAA